MRGFEWLRNDDYRRSGHRRTLRQHYGRFSVLATRGKQMRGSAGKANRLAFDEDWSGLDPVATNTVQAAALIVLSPSNSPTNVEKDGARRRDRGVMAKPLRARLEPEPGQVRVHRP